MLKPDTKYKTVDWYIVKTNNKTIINNYSFLLEIMKILEIKNANDEQVQEILWNKLIAWLTNENLFPSWIWYIDSGKCLSLNTGWISGNKYEQVLKSFDIKI